MPKNIYAFEILESGNIVCITGESCEETTEHFEFLIDGKNKLSFSRPVHQLRTFLEEETK